MSERFFRLTGLFAALALLAACAPALPTPAPLPTAQPLQISLDPALFWLEPAISACAATQPDLAILRADGDPAADLAFHLGPPARDGGFSAALGQDELVLVVHPDNPVETLPAADVTRLFTDEGVSWDQVLNETNGTSSTFAEPVEALVYPAGSALNDAFLAAFDGINRLGDGLLVAPSPAALRTEVAARPGAVGLLPARWLDGTVKPVTVAGLDDAGALRLPVVVTGASEPQGAARAWLLCVQDILLPTNPA